MATVREGNKAVLLIVDAQVGVVHESWDASRIIKNVSRAVERARAGDMGAACERGIDRWLHSVAVGAGIDACRGRAADP